MRAAAFLGLAACGVTISDTTPDAGGDAITVDAATDALVLGAWGAPTPVAITPDTDDDPSATGDLLELYFNRASDIYVAKRATATDPWGTPVVVAELSSMEADTTPEVSYDGLEIYFASARPGGLGAVGDLDIWRSSRASRTAAWTAPVHVPALSTPAREASPAISADGLAIVLESVRDKPENELYLARRVAPGAAWQTPALVTAVNIDGFGDGNAMLSADQLELYFDSNRTGNSEIYVARRASVTQPFGAPELVVELMSAASDGDAWIAPDRRLLMFTSTRDGTARLWESRR